MTAVQDLALALRNLQIDYKRSLIVEYEGNHFESSVTHIAWLESQLMAPDSTLCFLDNTQGFPCQVLDVRGLLDLMHKTLSEAASRYITESTKLREKIQDAFTVVPDEPEHEE